MPEHEARDAAAGAERRQLEGEFLLALRRAGSVMQLLGQMSAERIGINATDLNCLNIVALTGHLTAGELAAQTGLTTASITAVLDRLEEGGFVRRVRDPGDRRRVMVELSAGPGLARSAARSGRWSTRGAPPRRAIQTTSCACCWRFRASWRRSSGISWPGCGRRPEARRELYSAFGAGWLRLPAGKALNVRLSLASTRRAHKKPKSQLGPRARRRGRAARAAHPLDPVVPRLSDGVVRALPPAPRDRRAARRAVRPAGASRAGPAAARLLDLGGAARPVPRPGPCLPRADRRRGRGRVPAAATGLADWSALHRRPAAGRPGARRCARPARPRCSSARWRPGPAAGAGYGRRAVRRAGSPWPPPGPTWAATWRCGSARAPATPSRSATCPGWAGTTCAGSASYPTGARSAASSATCRCWCTGRAAR